MIVGTTKSVCPVCFKVLDANKVVGDDGNIYMEKVCPEHGEFRTLIWEGTSEEYSKWGVENKTVDPPVNGKDVVNGCPNDCGLCKDHLRKGCCMLLELTNRCNLKCPVCFAAAGENEPHDLSLEEIEKQYDYLMSHGGPFNIQLSGGEPTVRNDLPEIIRLGRQKGFTFFQLNTNGIRLGQEEGYADKLKQAGLNTVFLQFDGLSDDVYLKLRGKALLEIKKQAIANCDRAGLGTVLVPVIAPGVNDDQVGDILKFALDNMPAVRGVHFQPISYFGRCEMDRPMNPITIPRMIKLIEKQTEELMHAADFGGGGAENPYCSFHASYMKRSDGTLKPLARKSDCCCCTSSDDSRNFVAGQWTGVNKPSDEEESCCCCESEADKVETTESCCCCGSEADKVETTESCCCCGTETEKVETTESCCCCGTEAEKEEVTESCCCCGSEDDMTETSSLDDFLEQARLNTFSVSGMIFQDAYNLDLDRVRMCHICEVDSEKGMVPFCAYNLTNTKGEFLYRR